MVDDGRFWAHVEPQAPGCWIWTGSTAGGYGDFRRGGMRVYAHRYAYEQLVGEIPDGLVIDHLCRVHACVNPDHLEPVTSAENTLRGHGVLAKKKRQEFCVNGHRLAGQNLHVRSNGRRRCKRCHADYEAKRRARL